MKVGQVLLRVTNSIQNESPWGHGNIMLGLNRKQVKTVDQLS